MTVPLADVTAFDSVLAELEKHLARVALAGDLNLEQSERLLLALRVVARLRRGLRSDRARLSGSTARES